MPALRARPYAAVLLAVAAAFTLACTAGDEDTNAYALTVTRDGDVLARWTVPRAEAQLAIVEATVDGDVQRGPRLLDLLAASDAGTWSRLRVSGKGEGRTFDTELQVDAGEVDERWMLDISRRGTFKLAAPGLPRARWVRDVSTIALLR